MVQPRWRAMEPEVAAAGWLSQGVTVRVVDRAVEPPGTGTDPPRY